MNTDNPRAAKLNKLFDLVLSGKQDLTPHNSNLFIEAICTQQDRATCVNRLITSKNGLKALQASMRFDLSVTFFNGPATSLIKYIQDKDLSNIGGGSLLNQVLLSVVEPPIFWDSFVQAFREKLLQDSAQNCFAWLLLLLISLPKEEYKPYQELAQDPEILDAILSSSQYDTRSIGQKVKHILSTHSLGAPVDDAYSPGGRHDNDFVDFREIAILPTADEIMSPVQAFLRPSKVLDDPETEGDRLGIYLDNLFRLLREDMVYEMREELRVALGKKKGPFRSLVVDGLTLLDLFHEADPRRSKWGITLTCRDDLNIFGKVKPEHRKAHLHDNRNILRHQSMTCLLTGDGEIVAFPTFYRNEDLLAQNPPVVTLQLEGEASTTRALLKLKTAQRIKLLQITTAVFSYEPILKALQDIRSFPLSHELLFWKEGSTITSPTIQPRVMHIIEEMRADPNQNLQGLLNTPRSVVLDKSQIASLFSSLMQSVSLIQGPPGTGKSFIGALIAKVLHNFTKQTILVVCYTNHALDQFLEDLLNIGIPDDSMVRLGGKANQRTAHLTLHSQKSTTKYGRADWLEIDGIKSKAQECCDHLKASFKRYKFSLSNKDLLGYLEFEDSMYYNAFRVPQSNDGMNRIGRNGRKIDSDYLLDQWTKGRHAGIFRSQSHIKDASHVWEMPYDARRALIAKWKEDMLRNDVNDVYEFGKIYNEYQEKLERKFNEKASAILRNKRIIGCTTTGAAKYREEIRVASPDVLLVEEAGEILESHILTALGENTSQLVLIGDHKQLRPKVNHYLLTVEKGAGYDLNRSLFERLVLKGYPHETLCQQYRMRPEISALVRHLTYPELIDAPKTKNRANLLGVRDNVVFINHGHPEDDDLQTADRRDIGMPSSKRNKYEVQIVLKIIRYLGQQGYGTEKIVILTPYLGQLRELRDALKEDNDPILNDLDSYDLVRAGLLSVAAANVSKKPINLATIDNYQGEESDIVIVTLTRSNSDHNIGFMCSPERLNVLLSRARDALIMIGNIETFMKARNDHEHIWERFFSLLKSHGHIYDGLPVKCQRHPDRIALLKQAVDFDNHCPDGGCKQPCGTLLNCGIHHCPSKCHQLYDHSKMQCEQIIHANCSNGHIQQWKCHNGSPSVCDKCDREAKLAEKKKQEDFMLQEKRDAEQHAHAQRVAELDSKIKSKNQVMQDAQLAEERELAIRQKEKDLEVATSLAAPKSPVANTATTQAKSLLEGFYNFFGAATQGSESIQPQPTTPEPIKTENAASAPPVPKLKSPAREEWQRQKDVEGANNNAIDAIMDMTGLEDVKDQVLRIKTKIDTTKRQNTSLKDERFNIVLLGNPGTGKTTVARHYADFLNSVQIISGNAFVETTGSGLANDGVPGIKKTIEGVVKAGGGIIFVDEAYQLTSQHNSQGNQVLDYMLAEMENKVGTVVFILAGYNKEMEKFFEHNPGLPSRVPYRLQFKDYTDAELLDMLEKLVEKKYDGKMTVEEGIRGLYGRIAIRRLGKGRGRNGFGNARALHNTFSKIRERQSARLHKERRAGQQPDDFFLAKEDLIGPDPSKVMKESTAWKELQSLIGLSTVKESVRNLFDLIDTNYKRELIEKGPMEVSLNRVFLGSPGTGKTTVARLYGQILADLGLISNGEVVEKNPADFIGKALGESENNTKSILANTVGKVLIIDEAYMLYGGSTGNKDPYKTAVIDTIVAEVQSVPGDDRCVLLLGYEHEILEMFQNVNPGLSRRFAIENAFRFENFTDSELREVLNRKLKVQDLSATDAAKDVAIDVLSRARNRPNFGNAGEVENLLALAKNHYQKRQASLPASRRSPDAPFEPQDFDPEFDRADHASTNLAKLFEDVVGCEEVVSKLGEYQEIARKMKARGMDAREVIPTNFVFKGPPGTGKTTTARKMGQVYYDMGFLSSSDVIECSASDLVGQYVGQTGPKTKNVFERALGRVLFIDEAYRLSEGHFAKEAMDELVGILTQETFRSKLVVILAGYDQEMNQLMAVNTGLSSRFPDEVIFRNMLPKQCLEVLRRELKKKDIHMDALNDPTSTEYKEMAELIRELSCLPSWGNARDLKTLSQQMIRLVLRSSTGGGTGAKLTLTGKDAATCIKSMLTERRERCTNIPTNAHSHSFGDMQFMPNTANPPVLPTIRTTQTVESETVTPEVKKEVTVEQQSDERDAGVTDEVWRQLQADKEEAERASRRSIEELRSLEQELESAVKREEADKILAKKLAQANAKSTAEEDDLKRKREEMRIRECEARAERERRAAALEAKRQEEAKKRQQEAKAQAALRKMGVCVAGYRWINQGDGYRCAGGSHFVSNEQLEI